MYSNPNSKIRLLMVRAEHSNNLAISTRVNCISRRCLNSDSFIRIFGLPLVLRVVISLSSCMSFSSSTSPWTFSIMEPNVGKYECKNGYKINTLWKRFSNAKQGPSRLSFGSILSTIERRAASIPCKVSSTH